MTVLDDVTRIREDCKRLLDEVNRDRGSISLADANEAIRRAREAEAWLKGVRDRLA